MQDRRTDQQIRVFALVMVGVMTLGLVGLVAFSFWNRDDESRPGFSLMESPNPAATGAEFPDEGTPSVLFPPSFEPAELSPLADSLVPPPSYEAVGTFGSTHRFRRIGRSVGMLEVRFEDAEAAPRVMNCTAALLAEDLLLTNHHCIVRDGYQATHARVRMGFLNEAEPPEAFSVHLVPVEADAALDYAVLRVDGQPGHRYGTLRLTVRAPQPNETFFVIHHPAGRTQQLSREGCVAETQRHTEEKNLFLHRCDVEPGSSGSLLLGDADEAVVGLNRAGLPGRYGGATPATLLLAHSPLLRQIADGSYRPALVNEPLPEWAAAAPPGAQPGLVFKDGFEHAALVIENPHPRLFVPRTRPVYLQPNAAFTITATMQKNGPSTAFYGLVWGASQEAGSFDVFAVSDEGLFSVGRVLNGRWGEPDVRGVSSYIATGDGAMNELTVQHEGELLSFHINGKVVAEMPYTGLKGPGVGFGAGPGIFLEAQELQVWGKAPE